MSTDLQPTLRQLWSSGYYEECLAEAAKAKIADTPLTEVESREDILAFFGHMMLSVEKERENNRALFQTRCIEEDGDPARLDWLEEDLRRLLAVFQFIRTERVTVRDAINWMAGNPQDAELAPEFIAALDSAMQAKPEAPDAEWQVLPKGEIVLDAPQPNELGELREHKCESCKARMFLPVAKFPGDMECPRCGTKDAVNRVY